MTNNKEQVTNNKGKREKGMMSNEQLAMNNKQVTNNKGKKGAFLLCSLLIVICYLSCDNGVNPGRGIKHQDGYGRISVSLIENAVLQAGALNGARTVFPSISFTRYVYTFTKAGQSEGIEIAPHNGYFTLEVGAYTVKVDAYAGAALAASGVSKQFNVGPDALSSVEVGLTPVTSGQGTFSYSVTSTIEADIKVKLQKWPGMENVTLNPVDGNQTLQLDSGSYLLTATANKDTRYAGLIEIVYIYPSLTTEYTKIFDDGDLIVATPVTIAAIPLAAPVVYETPVMAVDTEEYWGTVTWNPEVSGAFGEWKVYTAAITLMAKTGYTLHGVTENFFTIEGADSVSNDADSGVVSATFPTTRGPLTPTADDYDIANLTQMKSSITAVTITPKDGKSPGAVTIYYNNSTTLPTEAGSYEVTFDVAADLPNWYAAKGLSAGTLTIATHIYVITGSGTTFTATASGATIGTANQPIQNVIDAIKASANGEACVIQFENLTNTLNIGANSITFDGSGSPTWGLVTLTGRLTSNSTAATGVIILSNGASINSSADLAVTGTGGYLIYNNSAGDVRISGGAVSATTGVTVYNASTGKITVEGTANVTSANVTATLGTIYIADSGSGGDRLVIAGGTVQNTASNADARAVYNASTGGVTISDGTVSATTGVAVYNNSTGKITVEGMAHITSANVTDRAGTIVIASSGTATADRLVIAGGTVQNTGTSSEPRAVFNASTGAVTISGGTVSARRGSAVYNISTGKITVSGTAHVTSANASLALGTIYIADSGSDTAARLEIQSGTVESTGANAVYNSSTGGIIISGGTVSGNTGYAVYSAGKITVEGTAKVTSNSSNTIYITSSGTDTATVLEIKGGTVENIGTSTTSRAVSNVTHGGITISGGTVSSTVNGVYNYYSDTILTISGGTVLTTQTAISNGTVTISGGTVSSTMGNTVSSSGTITISGGTVSATTGSAVYNNSTGKITISGTAKVTSANVTATSGTIYITSSGTDTADRLEISGGTVENTAANANARVVYNASTGGVTISGGTVSAAGAGYYAVYNNNANAMLTLSGNPGPAITGILRPSAAGKLTAASGFTPGAKKYTLEYASYAANGVAVAGGSSLLSNFALNSTAWGLKVSGSDLVVVAAYAITLSETSTYTFTAAAYGYGAQTARTVTVTNAGTQATGQLNVALSGTNESSFTLSKTTINSIAASGTITDTFTVVPKTGLAAGTHTATVTVSGTNITSQTFNVSFTVNNAVINIAAVPGVTAPVTGATPVTAITETTQYTGTVAWNGNPATFASGTVYTATITLTAKANYTLTGVAANFFTVTGATTVSNPVNSGVITAVFPATATYGITLSQTSAYTFPDANVGYSQQTALSVNVTNTGNQATGGLTAALSGTNSGSFTLSTTSISSIAVGATSTGAFTVRPNNSLVGGTYTATVTVSGSNGISASFTVSFMVRSYSISLSPTGTYTFSDVNVDYSAAPAALSVNVTNTGNQATGALTAALSGTNSGSFTLSPTSPSISSIAVGGTTTGAFTIRPNTGLTSGIYTATVTVTGGNGITAAFNVSFTVNGPYIITSNSNQNSYTATRNGVTVGTANQTMQNVINAIRTNANGNACTIQFGDNVTVLNFYSYPADFNNTGGTWGAVTLTGKITGNYGSVLSVSGTVSVTSTADIESTAGVSGRTIYHNSTGTLTISGGTVSATQGVAVYNNSTGKITVEGTAKVTSPNVTATSGTIHLANSGTATEARLEITGGTVENTSTGNAVYNASIGGVTISGGTVSATTGVTVYNASTGKITVKGTANVTSANVTNTQGTIYLANSGTDTADRLVIAGGTVQNTRSNVNARAVYNASTGGITISGGTVQADQSIAYAVYNASTGTLTISGGTISARYAVLASTGTVSISGGTISATAGEAIKSSGKVTVSQAAGATTLITSANSNATSGTICQSGSEIIEITGGTVENTDTGKAVYNASTGTVSITGGTVSAVTGVAVHNASTGKITVSRAAGATTRITSANVTATQGTIYLADSGTATAARLEITGGTVENTAADANARAIYNASTSEVIISGGTVSAITGVAVHNASTGKITVSGTATKITSASVTVSRGTIFLESGTIEITGGTVENTAANENARAIYILSTGGVTISGGTVQATGTGGKAIQNFRTGALNISGGTISATGLGGNAIYNNTNGKITVSGSANITSSNSDNPIPTTTTAGTIYLGFVSGATGLRFEMTGGTVSNTYNGTVSDPLYGSIGSATILSNAPSGSGIVATITGGTITNSGVSGNAVYAQATGTVTVSGATITGGMKNVP